ncbi:hypothetical protein [Nocardia anaemiae]|uniref:hypothetical protein n=1 Tax=Nocardia anaemiae TaxID=263910 RepID=UPI001C3FC340|nr:hypothetical protein [Nocardia anaemiae]
MASVDDSKARLDRPPMRMLALASQSERFLSPELHAAQSGSIHVVAIKRHIMDDPTAEQTTSPRSSVSVTVASAKRLPRSVRSTTPQETQEAADP